MKNKDMSNHATYTLVYSQVVITKDCANYVQ